MLLTIASQPFKIVLDGLCKKGYTILSAPTVKRAPIEPQEPHRLC